MNIRFFFFLCLLFGTQVFAYDPHSNLTRDNKLPKELENIGFSDVTGKSLNLDIPFRDESGKTVRFSDFLSKGKPVLLSPVYFKCPTLCNFHLNGVFQGLKALDWTLGKEYQYIAVSIDPKENESISFPKKGAYLKEYGREGAESGLHLLTGTQESIDALTKQLDFRYAWDEEAKQYIHASGVYVLTPEGKVSRIFQGIQLEPRDLKFAFLEASSGKIGSFVDKFALFCFQFDPRKNKYTIYAYRMMQFGGAVTLLLLGAFLYINWRKITNNNRQGVT
ncbi:SCO family protein [Leptospira meyeri]|uniref:Protein SCO1/2 n=1 Tax=Leptospira meyeri TaxID=29508 RepID=A0A4R8MKT8_LEPME|nr:SCO family protein [Leptospira meyeri]EKJ87082.1 SCO1/SenC [Leptospira meyeri serovar Hardjo str. Went 5]EMJ88298.1 SCO1/SenC [Leptospira meyeri serovar Semaranga str. Veldrot Semarang 173]MCW7487647.1 SCO family protein [Leptospira meyeri]PJZ79993.1 SCO family protein [Leptospira meyeri]PJZ96047.1 SCO family protein [Leptospira meyeri]